MTATVVAPRSEEYEPFPSLAHKNLLQERFEVPTLVRALDLPKGRRILEVGCGRGVALPPLARTCAPVYLAGLDLDCHALAEAVRHVRGEGVAADLFEGDVREMPFPDASFDVVVDFGTCYHIARTEDALAEVSRVLAPGGLFVSETPVSQLLAHPCRTRGRRLPWRCAPELVAERRAVLWSKRAKR
jgi:ubiquinone/menaquinone biosynthesis C-methylase UbiE